MHLRTVQTQLSVSIQAGSACHRSIEISMQALDRDCVCVCECVRVLSCDVSSYGGRGYREVSNSLNLCNTEPELCSL